MSKINVPLFRKIQDHIRKNSSRFLMSTWQDEENSCGTAFCICGWACAIDRKKTGKKGEITHAIMRELGYSLESDFFCTYGAKILGIEHSSRISTQDGGLGCPRLFVADYWPQRFKRMYYNDEVNEFTPELAELACKVIDDFIATDGWMNVPENYFSENWKEPEPVNEEAPAPMPAGLPFPVRVPSNVR